ncbi:MAG TPA: DUF1269 domain-containing protein [Candidatus Dormibacteraeota bacterium]|nr:DUF1269 domain-containing protein [Candidatus Dormibacteraeota bacterium]
MQDQAPLQAVVAAFPDEQGASRALEQLRAIDKDLIGVKQAAVLVRDADDHLQIRESHHVGRGAVLGGVAGAVVGLIAGPVGWVAVGGAAVGALAARLRDSGFPDARLREIGEALTPGTSALIAIIEHRWVSRVEDELRTAGARYATEAVKAEVATQLDEVGAGTS